ncbi:MULTISPECIES: tRNA lysidine(34) synthetase TilS [unclassified Cryobacterium]|uniref:tRNA lysidine(34) synthetase TilS n=1 Tax=unclassified Cryobacterium TaxID=2649013 RepID=UPI00106B2DEC|nr:MULTISPECIES: tRNA lysidine(34) synthetase TilS [unclassified Cryobacterium]TFC52695.1 tRNA lysidine(34) synthetase TilS [Cryobacterium sp. TMB3-1-2]TFC60265.1 tRNA lysidine(34) synthetase TilS [Cryobacterium sp. TMB1-7]TFC68359.1 tRNA lysidine(34) synthetase TilS [Cryobacterium sp. TMB3-15]TFC74941.1 tRNA lysidine(34) synthetase TilS [Cryobacterium sp. TMB3-10]TFD38399.1 tRNA lysidine(34) synthetase TilS [Cryobacterium sp. TMB3-12]
MESTRRPRLSPAIADLRRAVRELLPEAGLVLVGLSGGADSLALAAATAFEAPRAGLTAGAVIVDHGLQAGSADTAAVAAGQAQALGLDPVLIVPVTVTPDAGDGPEAAARTARYAAFEQALAGTGAIAVLLGHTLDDQAETVLLGLARGSGATSLQGMASISGPYRRPLLGIRRVVTRQACLDAGLPAWSDPQNADPRYSRVRVRQRVLPVLEAELGPGIAEALARTAETLREDADALDALVRDLVEEICEPAEAGIGVSVAALAVHPAALRQRMIRHVVAREFGVAWERSHTLAVARLVTDWHGQNALDLPGVRVERLGGTLVFSAPRPT